MNRRIKICAAAMSICMLMGAASCNKKSEKDEEIVAPEGYTLVWNDEFDGDELSLQDWNREVHSAGWVNHELQAYRATEENSYVEDGNLVIKPIKVVDDSGRVSYTSGRVNTAGRHEIKYGYIEARIKFPEGQGFLPAFWMMPKNENYGHWPICGEIDIVEILGQDPDTVYGTIHYGSPHGQNQGMYTIPEGDFTSEYHVFALEWEPGLLRWYVDGVPYYETSDWFCKTDGGTERDYPAPFNQEFHVIFNVAVGGDWPGSPDETTIFDERACMYVDYIRYFQRDSYDENVQKPEKVYDLRDADETGNYVLNGDAGEAEDLTDDAAWRFMLFNEGTGGASIGGGEITVETQNAGTVDYSIQLVQAGLPLENGASYRYTFDAYADEARTMIADISGPDVNYVRYLEDQTIDLTTDWQTYSFDFTMNEETDDNGRIEFNMGDQDSTATIHITNVRLEKIS